MRILKLLVGLTLLAWLLHKSGVTEFSENLTQIRASAFATTLLVFALGLVVGTVKWRSLLGGFSLRRMLAANLISLFYSLLLSGQLAGEAVKAYKLSRGRKDSSRIIASILTDKLTGLVALASLGLAGAALGSRTAPSSLVSLLAAVAIGISGAFAIVAVPHWDRAVVRILSWATARAPRWTRLLTGLEQVHNTMVAYGRRPGQLLRATALGVLFQISNVVILTVFAHELGIALDGFDLAWIFAVVSLAVLLPLSIAGLGIREGTFAAVLGLYGVGISTSIVLSLAFFSLQLLAGCVGALIDLRFSHGRLGSE